MFRKHNTTRLTVEHLETRTVPSATTGTTDLIVRFIGTPSPATQQVLNGVGASVAQSWFGGQLALVALPTGADVPAALRTLRAVPQISFAEPDAVFGISATTVGPVIPT